MKGEELIGILIQFGIPFGILFFAWATGRFLEKRHFASIREREQQYLGQPALSARFLDDERALAHGRLAMGSVVVSVDHFKRFLAGFRTVFGGELKSYSPLIDRGRREAILRMKESAPDADAYLNVRLETSTISNGQGKAMGTVEVLAYGTAVTYAEKGAA